MTDEEIVSQIQIGNKEAFGKLIERYEAKMLRYANRFLFDPDNAKDAVQEVFIKVYINIASFDNSKKFSPWLYRIAHNNFINEIKKNKREPLSFVDFDVFLPYLKSVENPDQNLLDEELKQSLDSYINKINVRYKEILILYYFEDLSYKEISDVLHIPVSSVGIRLSRAKNAIRKLMKS